MLSERVFEVLLLPRQEVAGRFGSLGEADAWMQAYNEAAAGQGQVAVVAEGRVASTLPCGTRRGRGPGCSPPTAAKRSGRTPQ